MRKKLLFFLFLGITSIALAQIQNSDFRVKKFMVKKDTIQLDSVALNSQVFRVFDNSLQEISKEN
jgi:hypothetical protein